MPLRQDKDYRLGGDKMPDKIKFDLGHLKR